MSAKNGNGKANPKAEPNKGGRPTKATRERIKAILEDLTLGLTEEQACAANDVHFTTFIDWKNNTDKFPELRAKAQALRIKFLLKRKREAMEQKLDWKEVAWELERIYKNQFADPAKLALQFNQQINNTPWSSEAELDEARRVLDEVDARQKRRVLDEVDAWQERRRLKLAEEDTRQRARRNEERDKSHQEINSHDDGSQAPRLSRHSNDFATMEEPERVAPGTSTRASDLDPLSGMRRRRGGDGKSP